MSKSKYHHHPEPTSVRRLLYARGQTAEVLGGISLSTVIRLEREGRITPIKLLKDRPGAQVFHRVEEVEALAIGGRADA